MLQRLSSKGLVHYEKYKGVTLSESGRVQATLLIRKHRLWETFLVSELGFQWHEVHDIAEELEHINSTDLINRLDTYLGHPKFDPHGDPIPNADGKFTLRSQMPLDELEMGTEARIVGIRDHDDLLLRHLTELGIAIDSVISVVERFPFDKSTRVHVDGNETTISSKVSQTILVKPVKPV